MIGLTQPGKPFIVIAQPDEVIVDQIIIKHLDMRRVSLILLTMLLLVSCGGTKSVRTAQAEGEYDVFLLIGQSNMAGRGYMLEGDDQVFDKNVFLLNEKGEPVPATNPLNRYSTIRKELSIQHINPGYSFSMKVSERTGRRILLVVNAKGGTSIRQWMKGAEDGFYDQAVLRAEQGMKYGPLKAILWHQGCGDIKRKDTYLDSLEVFVANLRKDLQADVPFVAGELGRWRKTGTEFNEMIHGISDRIPNSDWISSEGCMPIVTSKSEGKPNMKDPHFDRDSQIRLGERYAEKILKMCY